MYPYFYMYGYTLRCIHISYGNLEKLGDFEISFCFYRCFYKYQIFVISTYLFSQIFFIKSHPVAGLR